MRLVPDSSSPPPTRSVQTLLTRLADPAVETLWAHTESASLRSSSPKESMGFMCVPIQTSGPPMKHLPVPMDPASDTDISAEGHINPRSLDIQCPRSTYYRVCYHTHDHSLAAQSLTDHDTARTLLHSGIADTMCALGIDGVECHFLQSPAPVIARSEWGPVFLQSLRSNSNRIALPTSSRAKVAHEMVTADQVMCRISSGIPFTQPHLACHARRWHTGEAEYPLGTFSSASFTKSSIEYVNDHHTSGFIVTPDKQHQFTCFALSLTIGPKLICL